MGASRARRARHAQPHSKQCAGGLHAVVQNPWPARTRAGVRACLLPAYRCARPRPWTVAQTNGRHGPHITVCSEAVTESGWSICGAPLFITCLLARYVQRRHCWQCRSSRHSFTLSHEGDARLQECACCAAPHAAFVCLVGDSSCVAAQQCCRGSNCAANTVSATLAACSVSAAERRLKPLVQRKHTLCLQPPCAL